MSKAKTLWGNASATGYSLVYEAGRFPDTWVYEVRGPNGCEWAYGAYQGTEQEFVAKHRKVLARLNAQYRDTNGDWRAQSARSHKLKTVLEERQHEQANA